jgi:DUF4097 and DUF4098 domain-containing protein YvlB
MLKACAASSCLLVATLAASACTVDVHGDGAGAVVTQEQRFPADDGVELTLHTFDGSIDVRSWDNDEVVVRIEKTAATDQEAEQLEVRATHEGNRIVLEAIDPGRDDNVLRIGPGESVSYTVRAPRRLTLEARTSDGAIRAADLEGRVTLNTGDGAVEVDRVDGDVRVRTGDGPILVRESNGTVDVNSGDGTIEVSARLESLRVHSGDGAVHVDVADGSVVKTDWSLTTGDGRMSLRLPAALNAQLEADSGDGRITADWVNDARRDDDRDSDSFRGRLGNGGSVIRLRSGDGSIDISRR